MPLPTSFSASVALKTIFPKPRPDLLKQADRHQGRFMEAGSKIEPVNWKSGRLGSWLPQSSDSSVAVWSFRRRYVQLQDRMFSVSRLQHVQSAVFDRELEILYIAKMLSNFLRTTLSSLKDFGMSCSS